MLVERGLQVMNVEAVGDAYAIASNYLRRTGVITDTLATNERPQCERIGDTGERLHGRIWQRIDDPLVIAETRGEGSARVEVEAPVRVSRHLSVFFADLLAEGLRVNS